MTQSLPVPFEAALEAVKSSDTATLKKFVKGVLDVVAASASSLPSDAALARSKRRELLSAPDATPKRSTLLHWAAYLDNLDAVKLLAHYGSDVDAAEADGKTPLHWAGFEGNAEMVRLLLRLGANYELLDSAKQTACHLAIINNYVDVARLFPNYQAIAVSSPYIPLTDPDPDYQTPLRTPTPRRVHSSAPAAVSTVSSSAAKTMTTETTTTTSMTTNGVFQQESNYVDGREEHFASHRSASSVSSNLEAKLEPPRPTVLPAGGARSGSSEAFSAPAAPASFLSLQPHLQPRSAVVSPSLDTQRDLELAQRSPLYDAVCSPATAPAPVIGARAAIPPPPKPILSPEEVEGLRLEEKELRRAERRLRKADKRRELIHELVALYAEEELRIARQRIHWLPQQQAASSSYDDGGGGMAGEDESLPTRQQQRSPPYYAASPAPVAAVPPMQLSRINIPSTRFEPDTPLYIPRTAAPQHRQQQQRAVTPRSTTPRYRPPWKPPSAVLVTDPATSLDHPHHLISADPVVMKKFDVRSY